MNLSPSGHTHYKCSYRGVVMADNQSGKPEKKPTNPGRIALIGAVATGLALFNMATNTEAPSQAVMIMQWFFLALGLIGLGGGLIMLMSQK